MPLGGAVILWNEAKPAGSDSAGQGDDEMRSIKTSVRNALDSEHFFASSSSTAGAHRPGSARVFSGPRSELSASGDSFAAGRLMQTSDESKLYSVGTHPVFLGGPNVLSIASSRVTFPQVHRWEMEGGIGTGSGHTVEVVFSTPFLAPPVVTVSALANQGTEREYAMLYTVTASSFTASQRGDDGTEASNATMHWMAFGIRAL